MEWGNGRFREDQAVLSWRFALPRGAVKIYDDPGFAAPDAWLAAIAAVARDLRCRQYGREFDVDWLMWELSVFDDWSVGVAGQARGLGGFGLRSFVSTLDTPAAEATVWIADMVQTDLAGYESIQWPSRGKRMLEPRLAGGDAVWIDTESGKSVAAIGGLCGAA